MQAFRDQIVDQQRAAGVRVIKPPHALGFLDSDLPRHTSSRALAKSNRKRFPNLGRAVRTVDT
jgi:hypothetical protein